MLKLNAKESEVFVEALMNPQPPNEALKKAALRYTLTKGENKMADEQIELIEDAFNWNRELNMPQRVVDNMSLDEVANMKRLKTAIRSGFATSEEVAEYTRAMLTRTW